MHRIGATAYAVAVKGAVMQFSGVASVLHPPAVVLATMIDQMESVVPFLPNIDGITTCKREQLPDGRIRIVRRWQGQVDQVPVALRAFVSPEWLAWMDTAIWVPAECTVGWTHSPVLQQLAGLYRCAGTNYFEPQSDGRRNATRIRITGNLEVYPHRLPGLPRLLADRLAPHLEKFLIGLITPNLTDLAYGLQRYLDGGVGRRQGGRR
jgi:hypothetical protein